MPEAIRSSPNSSGSWTHGWLRIRIGTSEYESNPGAAHLAPGFNFVGTVVAPVLHAYFDIFSAFIQTLIFITLTMLLISVEIPAPVAKNEKVITNKNKKDNRRRITKC